MTDPAAKQDVKPTPGSHLKHFDWIEAERDRLKHELFEQGKDIARFRTRNKALAEALDDLVKAVDAHNHYLRTGSRTAFAASKYTGSLDRARAALKAHGSASEGGET